MIAGPFVVLSAKLYSPTMPCICSGSHYAVHAECSVGMCVGSNCIEKPHEFVQTHTHTCTFR